MANKVFFLSVTNDSDKSFKESDNWIRVLKIKVVIGNTLSKNVCQLQTMLVLRNKDVDESNNI